MRFLIDTNTIIHYLKNEIPIEKKLELLSIFKIAVNISVITKIELLGWRSIVPSDNLVYYSFIGQCTLFQLTDEVVEETITLRKQYGLKTPDAIIAATAIVNNMTLISRNDKDFQGIKHLKYMNPFKA